MPLESFSLEGAARADLRQAQRRANRDGATFEMVDAPRCAGDPAGIARGVGRLACGKKYRREALFPGIFRRALSLELRCGRGSPSRERWLHLPTCGAAESTELSVDLMRYNDAAPKGVIDYMLIECMLWGKSQGFRWFNLGMAPLSGLEEHALAPAWHKLGRIVQRYGETFYNFEGLRKFKEKFNPVWRPRYLAAPDGLAMAGALLDVTALISGGVRNVLRK